MKKTYKTPEVDVVTFTNDADRTILTTSATPTPTPGPTVTMSSAELTITPTEPESMT